MFSCKCINRFWCREQYFKRLILMYTPVFFSPPSLSVFVPPLGVIVLAFVLCWLPFHVGRTIFFLYQGSDMEHTQTSSQFQIHSLPDIAFQSKNIIPITNLIHQPKSDQNTYFLSLSMPIEMSTHAHTDRDKILCDVCANVQKDKQTDADTQTYSYAISHLTGGPINTNTATHDLDPGSDMATQFGRFTEHEEIKSHLHDNTNPTTQITDIVKRVLRTHNRRLCCVGVHSDMQNCIYSYINFQNTLGYTSPLKYTYTVTPLLSDNAHNDTPFNGTFTPPDSDLYFLYHFSQYFNLVSSVLFYLSAAINPLLYNLMSARYRHAVHSLIHTHSQTQTHHLQTLTAQPSTTTL